MASVVDTHALVWFLEGERKLGARALQLLREPQERLISPSIVLAELKHLVHHGRTPLTLREVFAALEADQRCIIYPLDVNVIELMPATLDIHDGIICGTALVYQRLLRESIWIISKDRALVAAGLVETVW